MRIHGFDKNALLKVINENAQNKKRPERTKQQQPPAPEAADIPAEDTAEISAAANQKAEKKPEDRLNDQKKKLEEMRGRHNWLLEELKKAKEANKAEADGWKTKIKCMQIAMRIMAGDNVPIEDHRYLAKNDMELYSKAISMRVEKQDPKEHDRLSEDEEDRVEGAEDDNGDNNTEPAAVDSESTVAEAAPSSLLTPNSNDIPPTV